MKDNKGITLVALIITVIILLILAVVAINSIQGDGVIRYAQNSRDDYRRSQENEISTLEKYMTYADEVSNGNKEEEITFTITLHNEINNVEETRSFTVTNGTTWQEFFKNGIENSAFAFPMNDVNHIVGWGIECWGYEGGIMEIASGFSSASLKLNGSLLNTSAQIIEDNYTLYYTNV